MHSSSADWVLGLARLISSPMTMFANTGPRLNSKWRLDWSNTDTPVTSLGSRSGVNWMRLTVQSTDRASALASMVLPTPGTSSMSRCPSASSTVREAVIASRLPAMTVSTFCTMPAAREPTSSMPITKVRGRIAHAAQGDRRVAHVVIAAWR